MSAGRAPERPAPSHRQDGVTARPRAPVAAMDPTPRHPVPVFPLPNVVLFPRTTLPLHVFELRYRTMVREALSGERLIAMALLKPGWRQDYHGSPEFHAIGCVGRIHEVEWLPNDCYDLRLAGLARVRFDRIVKEFPYRAARVSLLPEHPYPEDDPLVALEKQALGEAQARLVAALRRHGPEEPLPELAHGEEPLERIVNALAMVLPMEPGERQVLLEEDSILERAQQVRTRIEHWLLTSGPQARPGPPPTEDLGGEQN